MIEEDDEYLNHNLDSELDYEDGTCTNCGRSTKLHVVDSQTALCKRCWYT